MRSIPSPLCAARMLVRFVLPIVFMTQACCGAEWVNISGTITWSKAEEIPERPIVDVSEHTKQIPSKPTEIRRFGWVIDPVTLAVPHVVVHVKKPRRIHPDYPQDAEETKKAFASFFRTNIGVPLEEIKSVADLPAAATLEAIPSLVILSDFNCRPTTMAIRAGQPVVVVNNDSGLYNVQFYGRPSNVSQFCKPKDVTSHYFSAGTQNSVSCLIKSWMTLPVSVFDHPYFDTTDSRGRFRISRVPAGEVELCALFWRYSIDLGAGQIAYADLANVPLKLTATSDIDLGTIVLKGWPPTSNHEEREE